MIVLNQDGTLTMEGALKHVARQTTETIEVPEDLVTQQSDLLDRIFAFAFDVLGLKTIDVRILPTIPDGTSGSLWNVPTC